MGVQFSLLFGANDGCPILILGTAMDWSEKMDVLICQFGTAMDLVGKNGCPHLSILSFGQPLIWGECGCPLPHNSGQPSQFGTAINLGRIWVSSFSRLSLPPVTRPHQRPRRVARADRPGCITDWGCVRAAQRRQKRGGAQVVTWIFNGCPQFSNQDSHRLELMMSVPIARCHNAPRSPKGLRWVYPST